MATKAINKTDSMTMFSILLPKTMEDGPATVVNKVWASTLSRKFEGRCDIFAAPARLDQIEGCEIGSVQREGTDNYLQSNY
jgi:hypothetical protein